jgi:hypothetical protein
MRSPAVILRSESFLSAAKEPFPNGWVRCAQDD